MVGAADGGAEGIIEGMFDDVGALEIDGCGEGADEGVLVGCGGPVATGASAGGCVTKLNCSPLR